MKRYFSNRNFAIGATIVLLLFLMMIISIVWTPNSPNRIHDDHILEGPSGRFLLGTDYLGRDILSRVMIASQTAFIIGGGTLIISSIIGVAIGLMSGYFGGWLDEFLMRFVDAWMTIPGTIMVIVFVAAFGRGMIQTLIAISLTGFANFAKITRSKVLSLKESDHILWDSAIGVKKSRIIVKHILPDVMPTLLVVGALRFSSAILTEAALSYLGLGIQPPDASWGNILTRAQSYILTNWLYAFIPGLLITLMVIGFNLISDGLNKIYSEEGAY